MLFKNNFKNSSAVKLYLEHKSVSWFILIESILSETLVLPHWTHKIFNFRPFVNIRFYGKSKRTTYTILVSDI